MQQYIDKIYYNHFKNIVSIERNKRNNSTSDRNSFLDIELGIDTLIYFKNGSFITFQEKTRNNWVQYEDFTFEYYNNPKSKEEGEWFHLASQFYFYGYANSKNNGYRKYYILNVPSFRLFLNNSTRGWRVQPNPPPAKANFKIIPFSKIPENCFFYKPKPKTVKLNNNNLVW